MQCLMQLKHYYLLMISSAKHDIILTQFSKDFVHDGDFSQEVYKYYSNAKKLRRKSSYDFSVNFDKQEAFDCLVQAEEFIRS